MNDNIGKNLFSVRKQLRLPDFDYSMPGAYFVTICTQNKQCLFGAIKNGKMKLNPNGEIVQSSWIDLPNHYAGINNDVFAVMPNHVHGIIIIHDENRRSGSYISSEAEYLRLRAYGNPTLRKNILYQKSYVLLKPIRPEI